MMGFCPYIKGSLKESECHHDGYCSECPHNTKDDTISRQAAIELAMQYCPDDDGSCSKADRDIRELLDDLENLPSSEPEGLKDKLDDAYAHGYTAAEAKYRKWIEKFDRIIRELGVNCAYDMPSFWCSQGKDYKVIPTKYHKGYMQALADVEKRMKEAEECPEKKQFVF